MALRHAFLPALVATWVVACGGAVFNTGGDGGDAGSSSGGTSTRGGSSSTAGKPSKAGTHSGGMAAGGSTSVGGATQTAGTAPVAGGPSCEAVDCAFPACPGGAVPFVKPGECCPTCPPPLPASCDGVKCQALMGCPAGSTLGQSPGACCPQCIPSEPLGCPEIACPNDKQCPLGYVRGDLAGGCCTDCLPDPKFCNEDADCAMADRPRSCCGCPESISARMYQDDPCWSLVAMPRMPPPECYPQVVCDAVCGPCPPPGNARCENHRCLEMGLK